MAQISIDKISLDLVVSEAALAALGDATGVSAVEFATILGENSTAGLIGSVIMSFTGDQACADLPSVIAGLERSDRLAMLAQLRAFLAQADAPVPPSTNKEPSE